MQRAVRRAAGDGVLQRGPRRFLRQSVLPVGFPMEAASFRALAAETPVGFVAAVLFDHQTIWREDRPAGCGRRSVMLRRSDGCQETDKLKMLPDGLEPSTL